MPDELAAIEAEYPAIFDAMLSVAHEPVNVRWVK